MYACKLDRSLNKRTQAVMNNNTYMFVVFRSSLDHASYREGLCRFLELIEDSPNMPMQL